jgi:hypothetical protein
MSQPSCIQLTYHKGVKARLAMEYMVEPKRTISNQLVTNILAEIPKDGRAGKTRVAEEGFPFQTIH